MSGLKNLFKGTMGFAVIAVLVLFGLRFLAREMNAGAEGFRLSLPFLIAQAGDLRVDWQHAGAHPCHAWGCGGDAERISRVVFHGEADDVKIRSQRTGHNLRISNGHDDPFVYKNNRSLVCDGGKPKSEPCRKERETNGDDGWDFGWQSQGIA